MDALQIEADLAAQDAAIESIQEQASISTGEDRAVMMLLIASMKRVREMAANWALIEQMPKGTSLYRTPYTTWCCIASSNGKRGLLGEFFKTPAEAVKDLVEASCGNEPEAKG